MKIFSFILVCSLIAFSNQDNRAKWTEYKNKYSTILKPYLNSTNEETRYKIFNDNLNFVENQNQKGGITYKLGETVFSHLSSSEFQNTYLSKPSLTFLVNAKSSLPSSSILPTIRVAASLTATNLPAYVNWTAKGKVSPVKFQGNCGNCYAFTSVGAIESAYSIRYEKDTIPLSEQQIVDCTFQPFTDNSGNSIRNYGCSGGDIMYSLLYVQKYGLTAVYTYPYVSGTSGTIQSCQNDKIRIFTYLSSIKYLNNANTINDLKLAVSIQPITAYYYADPNFYQYKSGIYSSPNCNINRLSCQNYLNHAVLLTGYGIENGVEYWIAKNSWSTNWGENGYFRIQLGINACCIEFINFNVTII